MPVNDEALTKEEVILLRDWIDEGAPNKSGNIKFADDRKRKKLYITNQGCDLVAVVDDESRLVMRYLNVGNSDLIESPHMVKVSPDGNYWYVVFTAGSVVQKFNAIDDSFVAEAEIGYGSWNTIAISDDSKTAFAVDWSASGRIACIDLESMALKKMYQGSGLFIYPHGVSINENSVYVTAQTGNFIYKIDVTDINFPEIEEISLEPGVSPSGNSKLDAHEIIFSNDKTKYFVSCQKSNEVRVMDANTDTLITIIQTGQYASEFSISNNTNYLFVSCPEDTLNFPTLGRGCITVIDHSTLSFVKNIYAGYQPHGIALNDDSGILYVANRNTLSEGPAPHHTTDCGGRNGYITALDINSLELTDLKFEVSVDPYSVAFRKK
jgi:DNA-binding beta-propeller fold protein YncE